MRQSDVSPKIWLEDANCCVPSISPFYMHQSTLPLLTYQLTTLMSAAVQRIQNRMASYAALSSIAYLREFQRGVTGIKLISAANNHNISQVIPCIWPWKALPLQRVSECCGSCPVEFHGIFWLYLWHTVSWSPRGMDNHADRLQNVA